MFLCSFARLISFLTISFNLQLKQPARLTSLNSQPNDHQFFLGDICQICYLSHFSISHFPQIQSLIPLPLIFSLPPPQPLSSIQSLFGHLPYHRLTSDSPTITANIPITITTSLPTTSSPSAFSITPSSYTWLPPDQIHFFHHLHHFHHLYQSLSPPSTPSPPSLHHHTIRYSPFNHSSIIYLVAA